MKRERGLIEVDFKTFSISGSVLDNFDFDRGYNFGLSVGGNWWQFGDSLGISDNVDSDAVKIFRAGSSEWSGSSFVVFVVTVCYGSTSLIAVDVLVGGPVNRL